MNITTTPWTIHNEYLSCEPFPTPHTSQRTLQTVKESLIKWNLDVTKDIYFVTQDTTSASYNTFDTVDETNQLPCMSHTN